MLVLTRVKGDSIIISLDFVRDVVLLAEQKLKDGSNTADIIEEITSILGDSVEIKYLSQDKGRARLGFNAHPIIKIRRHEVPKSPQVAV